jgi:hypothetical protein
MTLARAVFVAGLSGTAACTSLLDIDGYEFGSTANGAGGTAAPHHAASSASGAAASGGAGQSSGGMAGSPNATTASGPSAGGADPCSSGASDCEVCLGQSCCMYYAACALDTQCDCFAHCVLVESHSFNVCGVMCGGMPPEPLFSNLYGCSVVECNACG